MAESIQKDEILKALWRFVRGEIPPEAFRQWCCSQDKLPEVTGKSIFVQIARMDSSKNSSIARTKQIVKEYARSASFVRCKCIELSDLTRVGMGEETCIFQSLEEIRQRGNPYWWLSLHHCRECGQWWLVAREERYYDDIYLNRVSTRAAQEILSRHSWPTVFDDDTNLPRIDAGVPPGE